VWGIPIHVWDEHLFKKIGNVFGDFVDFDEETIARKRFDFARVKISTEKMGLIDDVVELMVVGACFSIWVVEEGGGGRCTVEEKGKELDDVISQASIEGDVAADEGRLYSDGEGCSPRVDYSIQKSFLNEPTPGGQVAIEGEAREEKIDDVDLCCKLGGNTEVLCLEAQELAGSEAHALLGGVGQEVGGDQEEREKVVSGDQEERKKDAGGGQVEREVGLDVADGPFSLEAQFGNGEGVSKLKGGAKQVFEEVVCVNSSKHIRFNYDDSEASDFSDSLEDFEEDVGKVLKNRQKSRMKKQGGSFAKKQLPKAPDSIPKSPKSGNGVKQKYHVNSAHRRAFSQPLEREVEEWSEEEGVLRGRQACSLEVGGSQLRSVEETQVRDHLWRKNSVKELAARKELGIQNKVGVSHSLEEGSTLEKLVFLENVAVKLKVKREELRLH
jgi:hypothetical protein